MQYLALETKEMILKHTTGRDLASLSLTSRDFYSLASRVRFWREKFAEERIPLLDQPDKGWLGFYLFSRVSRMKSENFLAAFFSRNATIRLDFDRIPSPLAILTDKVPWEEISYCYGESKKRKKELGLLRRERSMRKRRKTKGKEFEGFRLEERIRLLERRLFYLKVYLDDKERIIYKLVDKEPVVTVEDTHEIGKEDLEFLVFRLYYYRVFP